MASERHCQTFPLRIPLSIRTRATELARKNGMSLNYFILVALTERIGRLELLRKRESGGATPPREEHAQIVAIDGGH